jgi:epoxide hydrolase 4
MSEITFDYAQVGGMRLHYATAGSGEKLVLLLHGFPEFWYSWRHQLRSLGDKYTVVAPDMRGYNLSDKPARADDYALDKLIDDVIGLIRYFGREKAAVVGHDWGAAIAWATALAHPEMVWKLAALQVPPSSVWRKNQTLRQALASWYMLLFQVPALPEWLLSRDDFAMLAESLKKSTVDPGVFVDADVREYKKSWRESGSLKGPINYYRANLLRLFAANNAEPERKITVPAMFIYGERDHAVLPETVRGVAAAVDAPFTEIRIPTAAHWVQQEAPEIVTDALRDFLDS